MAKNSDFEWKVFSDGTAAICGYTGPSVDVTIPAVIDGHIIVGIDNNAFSECQDLESITIPEGVTRIGATAFAGCTSLASISIPKSVTRIDDYAFANCTSLKNVTIPDHVKIGAYAFDGCPIDDAAQEELNRDYEMEI